MHITWVEIANKLHTLAVVYEDVAMCTIYLNVTLKDFSNCCINITGNECKKYTR